MWIKRLFGKLRTSEKSYQERRLTEVLKTHSDQYWIDENGLHVNWSHPKNIAAFQKHMSQFREVRERGTRNKIKHQ